jgi:D-alanyl-D-alanine carboxypeptidase
MRLWKGSISGSSSLRHRQHPQMFAAWLALAALATAATAPSASARVQSSILVDVQTGKILEARNPDSRCYPASLTKLMTLYITFHQLSTGKLKLGQELTVSDHAADQAPTKLYLEPGERISVESAILAITTRSANDAAVVLAEAIGGSEWKFAQMMNQTARELGLTRTSFRNASGLPNPYQRTTARDMSKLGLAILEDFPQYYHFFKAQSFDFRGETIYGHDRLLDRYSGVDGMKTGYTAASGFNIVTSAVRRDRRLLGVVMGGRTAHSRDRLMMALLNRGFAHLPVRPVTTAQEEKAPSKTVARYKDISPKDTEEAEASRPDLGWVVQIGGPFRTASHVRSALTSARHTSTGALKDAKPVVVRLGRANYLARFSGLDENTALDACRELRRRKFTCSAYQDRRSGVALAAAADRRQSGE